MLEAVVFDFDGVLVDSEPLHFRSFHDTLAEAGIELAEQDYFTLYLGLSDRAAFETIGAEHARPWTPHQLTSLMAAKAGHFERLERTSTVVFPGADAFVRAAAVSVPIAVASGARREEVVRMLDRADLTRYFSAIVAAEDVATTKPAPDAYLEAIRRLSAAAGQPLTARYCVAIEDSVRGLQSARAAGLKTIAVCRPYSVGLAAETDMVVASLASLTVETLRNIVST